MNISDKNSCKKKVGKLIEYFFQGIKKLTGGSRAAGTSKMECFVIIVNDWKPLTIITKCSILDVAAALDPPLIMGKMLYGT